MLCYVHSFLTRNFKIKGTGKQDRNPLKVVWLNRPNLTLPPDISLNLLNCPFNVLFIFKIFKQGMHLSYRSF